MTDMRLVWLPPCANGDHTLSTLSGRTVHLSPSSSGAGVQLSLLEGDCVGLTWPIPQAGLLEPGFFLCCSGIPARTWWRTFCRIDAAPRGKRSRPVRGMIRTKRVVPAAARI